MSQKYVYKPWNTEGGRLDAIVAGSGTWDPNNLLFSDTIQKLTYDYDSVGNVTDIEQVIDFDNNVVQTQSFTYDSLNRLTEASATGGTLGLYDEVYTYDSTTCNLLTKGARTTLGGQDVGEYKYNYDANHDHAVASLVQSLNENIEVNRYSYDDNGNMESRNIGGNEYELIYDAENRMTEVKKDEVTMAHFTYNGDGQRVKSVINGEDIYFVGKYYEFNDTTDEVTKYYFAGASRVAMRKYTIPQSMEVEYLLGDHLGSTSLTTDMDGNIVSEMRYTPWGEVRYHWIDPTLTTSPAYKLPIYSFTGQRSYMDDPSTTEIEGFGLMDYNARMYDPVLGRFTSADDVVAGGLQGYDRYNYVNNTPTIYTDPSGHQRVGSEGGDNVPYCAKTPDPNQRNVMLTVLETTPIGQNHHIAEYAVASIGVQNPIIGYRGSWFPVLRLFCPPFWKCEDPAYNSGEGYAKVSDAQMEAPYGSTVTYTLNGETHYNGVGLGLRFPGSQFPDQNNTNVALLAMMTRIKAVLEACRGNECNPTNTFMIAAMAGNAMFPTTINNLRNGAGEYGIPDENGIFDWKTFISENETNVTVLRDFINNMVYLQSLGYELPKGINWGYVCGLLEK